MSNEKTDWITLNGARLGYAIHGAATGKQPLLFIHGYAMRSTGPVYGQLLDRLAEHHIVYALDLRGHGESRDDRANWSFETHADDIHAFAQAMQLEQPVFVGHSFGAPVGLYTQVRHPGSFAAFCLLCPGPADHRRDPVDALRFMIENGRNRDLLRPAFEGMFTRHPSPWTETTLDAVTLLDSAVHRALQAANPNFSIDDDLQDISVPTLLLRAESDPVVPAEIQHDMATKLPNCRETIFPGEGHMLPIESASLAAEAIALFLREIAAEAPLY